MKCLDCGKELKGGFGVGLRPFRKFRCYECTMIEHYNLMGFSRLKLADDWIASNYPKLEGKKFKAYSEKLEALLSDVRFFLKVDC